MIDLILGVLSPIWGWLAAGAAALAALLGVYVKGRRDARHRQAQREAEAYRETREAIDNAERPVTPDDVAEWLRERAHRR